MTSVSTRTILHVDMDAFFVSVELIDRPELRGTPVVVGGTGPRGVVAAASYEARAFGVHSAQPSAVARRLCPQATFLDGRHARYREVSGRVMEIFGEVTPLVEPLSLDEAFLDVGGRIRGFGPAPDIAAWIRAEVLGREGLECTVGIAPNKFLAKLASGLAKPRATPTGPVPGAGVLVVDPDAIGDFLRPLPAEAMWGVGPVTLSNLQRLGVATIGDIARLDEASLISALGRSSGAHLHQLSRGLDDRPVLVDVGAKSISHEETFPTDISDRVTLRTELVRMADAVAYRLRVAGLQARTVSIKVRFAGFQTITRSITPPGPTDDGMVVLALASQLLATVDVSGGVRLLGVATSNLVEHASEQLILDLATNDSQPSPGLDVEARGEINGAVDRIRDRFGRASIGPARLATVSADLGVFEEGQQQWGPTGGSALGSEGM